jgi:hypothetical protein
MASAAMISSTPLGSMTATQSPFLMPMVANTRAKRDE